MSDTPSSDPLNDAEVYSITGRILGLLSCLTPGEIERAAANPLVCGEHRGNMLALAALRRHLLGEVDQMPAPHRLPPPAPERSQERGNTTGRDDSTS